MTLPLLLQILVLDGFKCSSSLSGTSLGAILAGHDDPAYHQLYACERLWEMWMWMWMGLESRQYDIYNIAPIYAIMKGSCRKVIVSSGILFSGTMARHMRYSASGGSKFWKRCL
jgi:hypothetical protein